MIWCINENGPWGRRWTIGTFASCFSSLTSEVESDLCTFANFMDLGAGWIAWPDIWMLPCSHPSWLWKRCFGGWRICFVFVLLLSPFLTELWNSFLAGWFCSESPPLSLSYTSRTLQWLLKAWLSCISLLGQMAGDNLHSPAPGREGCLSVSLWVFLKRFAVEDLGRWHFLKNKRLHQQKKLVEVVLGQKIQRSGF